MGCIMSDERFKKVMVYAGFGMGAVLIIVLILTTITAVSSKANAFDGGDKFEKGGGVRGATRVKKPMRGKFKFPRR